MSEPGPVYVDLVVVSIEDSGEVVEFVLDAVVADGVEGVVHARGCHGYPIDVCLVSGCDVSIGPLHVVADFWDEVMLDALVYHGSAVSFKV
jgi:hypothetical protein